MYVVLVYECNNHDIVNYFNKLTRHLSIAINIPSKLSPLNGGYIQNVYSIRNYSKCTVLCRNYVFEQVCEMSNPHIEGSLNYCTSFT